MSTPLRTLVTNDDGIDSPGLRTLAQVAAEAGLDVVAAAPHAEASGTSAGLTVIEEDEGSVFRQREIAELPGIPCYAVTAHPAFITLASLRGVFGDPPDLVLSGVNRGMNVGYAVVHSGTVGAALTGAMNGLRGMAVSLDVGDGGWQGARWDSAAEVVRTALSLLLDSEPGAMLNVNVPDVAPDRLGDLVKARLASFGAVQSQVEHRGGRAPEVVTTVLPDRLDPATDAALVAEGHATITALVALSEADQPVLPERLSLSRP